MPEKRQYVKDTGINIVNTTGILPAGFVAGFITNSGTASATITFINGTTYTMTVGETINVIHAPKGHDTWSINAATTTIKGIIYY